MTQRRNKRSLCAVVAGWQGDAVLALLAGPGLSSHHVFTQRLHLVCVSGAHFDQYKGGIHTTRGRVYITRIESASTDALYFMNLPKTLWSAPSPLFLDDSAPQHAAHGEEVSAGGGAGVGGSGRRPRSSGSEGRQQPQVRSLCRSSLQRLHPAHCIPSPLRPLSYGPF